MRFSWQLMTWRGVPVVLDWTVLLGLPWFLFLHRDLIDMISAFVGFFFLLLIHELGHATVAKWRKVPVIEIRLYIMHGHCLHEVPDKKSDSIWIAWGGVAAQFAALVVALVVSALLKSQAHDAYLHVLPLFRILIEFNIVIILFNLLPLPTLDGATAWLVLPKLWARVPKPNVSRWARDRKLKRQSKEIAADIINRLKKSQ